MAKQVNLEVITQEVINEQYAREFGASASSTKVYDLGDGETAVYTQLQLTGGLTVILHDDNDEIVLKSGEATIATLKWSNATVNMLRNLETMSAAKAFRFIASQSVSK